MQAPIYVSKEIVFTDAIRIGYGMGGAHNKKAIYDVLLDRYFHSYYVKCGIFAIIDSVYELLQDRTPSLTFLFIMRV